MIAIFDKNSLLRGRDLDKLPAWKIDMTHLRYSSWNALRNASLALYFDGYRYYILKSRYNSKSQLYTLMRINNQYSNFSAILGLFNDYNMRIGRSTY